MFEFGLSIIRGDLSTDGRWCFLVFWVLARVRALRTIRWSLLKHRLMDACPPLEPVILELVEPTPPSPPLFLLQVCSPDRFGFLNDVTQALWEMELTIQRVNVTTSPEGKAVDLFFVTDNRDELPQKQRSEDICDYVRQALGGDSGVDVECRIAGPVSSEQDGVRPISGTMPVTAQEYLFPNSGSLEALSRSNGRRTVGEGSLGPADRIMSPASVTVDNKMSPAHSVLHIVAKDRKGIIYDCLRALKDTSYQVSYGRIQSKDDQLCVLDLFIQGPNGKKLKDAQQQQCLCSRLKQELERPIRVAMVTKGPDSELLICCPVEECGRGRPRVLYDVTYILRQLDFQIFKADVTRHLVNRRQWEVYRFILQDKMGLPVYRDKTRHMIEEQVRDILMG